MKLATTALYQLNKRFDISGKVKYYLIDSDKIDVIDASGRDVPGATKDKFLSFSVGINYNIGSKNKAKHWHNPLNELYHNQGTLLKKVRGLTKDNDNDGVANSFDKHEPLKELLLMDQVHPWILTTTGYMIMKITTCFHQRTQWLTPMAKRVIKMAMVSLIAKTWKYLIRVL